MQRRWKTTPRGLLLAARQWQQPHSLANSQTIFGHLDTVSQRTEKSSLEVILLLWVPCLSSRSLALVHVAVGPGAHEGTAGVAQRCEQV